MTTRRGKYWKPDHERLEKALVKRVRKLERNRWNKFKHLPGTPYIPNGVDPVMY